jgi:hypothetical protein
MTKQASITPIIHLGKMGTPINVADESIPTALATIPKGDVGFQFGQKATRYLFAEKILSLPEVRGDRGLYTGLQKHLNVNPETAVVYDTGTAISAVEKKDQGNTVLLTRTGQQLFPAVK